MCFLPDDAARRLGELSPNAGRVYIALCDFRIHKYRVSFASYETISREYRLPLGSVRNAYTELKKKKWIRPGAYFDELLVGDFSPVDEKHPRKPIPARGLLTAWERGERDSMTPAAAIPETVKSEAAGEIPETVNPETVTEIPETVTEIPETVKTLNKDRARDPSTTSIPSTHTQAGDPTRLFREPDATGPRGVCVSDSKSRHKTEVRQAYADDPANVDYLGRRLGKGWVKQSADGESDDLIDAWLAARERARAAEAAKPRELSADELRSCPSCHGTGYEVIAGRGAKRCDHARLYERLAGGASSAVA